MPKDKLQLYTSLQSDLVNELKDLETRAQQIRAALKGSGLDGGEIPVPFFRARRGRKPKAIGAKLSKSGRKITTNDAILHALAGGNQLGVPEIVAMVNTFKGKVSKASINQGLGQLKKKGAIANPARGRYALKK
jgi:hypothetical protein